MIIKITSLATLAWELRVRTSRARILKTRTKSSTLTILLTEDFWCNCRKTSESRESPELLMLRQFGGKVSESLSKSSLITSPRCPSNLRTTLWNTKLSEGRSPQTMLSSKDTTSTCKPDSTKSTKRS